MATYTTNGGIKKISTGDESGTWGTSTNTNFDIIDRLVAGVGDITLSGTTHTLTTSDGSTSDGQFHVLKLGGSPSGTNTITISPNDTKRMYMVQNASGQTATFSQGSGANVSVSNGKSAIIYCDGAGSGAAVVDLGALLPSTTTLSDLSVTATASELNIMDGVTSTTAELNILDGVTATATELNILDGVTATTAELNLMDGGTTVGTTAVSDGDGIVTNDGGTMRQTNVTTFATYFADEITSMSNLVTTGALNSGSITSGFGSINNGSSAITTTGTVTAGIVDTSAGELKITPVTEEGSVDTGTSGTINVDCDSKGVIFFTANQTANRTINFRGDGSTTLNSYMDTNDVITISLMMKQGSSAYYLNAFQIDGSSVTPEWQGGTAPSAGNANSIDVYTVTIFKTASATFTVLASQVQYA
jgi:hypothetical protein